MDAETVGTTPFLARQLAFERQAIGLLARADVQAALATLAASWRAAVPGFQPQTYAQADASIREIAFMVALEVANDDPRRPEVVEISAGPHQWGGLAVPGGRWGINNPDTLYFAIPIEAGSRYVVRGQRAAHGPVDRNFSVQVQDIWATLANIGQRDLDIAADGSYRISIDDTPADGRANHLQHQPHGTVLIVRQTLADWTARPDLLTVERIAGPAPAAPRTEDALARQLIARLGDVTAHNIRTLQQPIFRQPVNTIPQPGARGDKSGYLVTQRNTLGHFRLLQDDEALLAVLQPGGAGYAAFTATNIWGITPDATRHQNSLNDRQAAIDADGSITLVVAHRDPGVHNWIDPGGLREGILMLRWQLLDAQGRGAGGPAITLRHVRLDALDVALPATVRRIDAAQRQQQLLERRTAYESRFLQR